MTHDTDLALRKQKEKIGGVFGFFFLFLPLFSVRFCNPFSRVMLTYFVCLFVCLLALRVCVFVFFNSWLCVVW